MFWTVLQEITSGQASLAIWLFIAIVGVTALMVAAEKWGKKE